MTVERKRLESAVAAKELVRVRRSIRRADVLEGFVVGLGKRWLLLHELDEVTLNAYMAIRIEDISSVKPYGSEFTYKALALTNEKPRPLPVGLDSVTDVLVGLQKQFPLVTTYTENAFPDECRIGHVDKITTRTLWLTEISPNAEWDTDDTSTWPLRDITRVDADGRYERALAAVGGPPPSA